jgi:hypothetical protein
LISIAGACHVAWPFGQRSGRLLRVKEEQRKQVVGHLDELRAEVAHKLGRDNEVGTHVDELRALVQEPNARGARTSASGLEKKLLAWEAEHPTLVSLAQRIVRALEDSGL